MLSTKERDRLKVLHEVQGGHLTQRAAAQQLRVTDRWVRKLLVRVKQEGDRGWCMGCGDGRRSGACRSAGAARC
ncbi:MAG: hypothetical protein ACRD3T_22050 [Terriglobia bacterium]